HGSRLRAHRRKTPRRRRPDSPHGRHLRSRQDEKSHGQPASSISSRHLNRPKSCNREATLAASKLLLCGKQVALHQAATSPTAAKLFPRITHSGFVSGHDFRVCASLEFAKESLWRSTKCQGTTSVVPQTPEIQEGALAPEQNLHRHAPRNIPLCN